MTGNSGNTSGLTSTTPASTQADAASRGDTPDPGQQNLAGTNAPDKEVSLVQLPLLYELGQDIARLPIYSYARKTDDPLYRPLKIFTGDPSTPKLDGAVALLDVAYEPLSPGPVGNLFEISNCDEKRNIVCRQADLEASSILLTGGYTPSQSDPRFHQQMLYAVCSSVYSVFQRALGRQLMWGFTNDEGFNRKLVLNPHYAQMANAYYSKETGEINFGYYFADQQPDENRSLPGGIIFTCLSHDIIAHEVTHALLDGLRQKFMIPTGPDVMAFHEAFADLVAIFQHFSYKEVLVTAIKRSRGALRKANLLIQLANQFGYTTGNNKPLRTAIEENTESPSQYNANLEPHLLGAILVNALFDAFVVIFERKTEIYLRLASQGSGILPQGELPHDLVDLLAKTASKLATQFLHILIRAIDYCPPVGITFGDYLQALITADYDIVPDDTLDYRGALIDAFRKRNIYPRYAYSLTEDALIWRGPRIELPLAQGLDFSVLRSSQEYDQTTDELKHQADELKRQAHALGKFVTSSREHMAEFGLVAMDDPCLKGSEVSLPVIESIRSARRSGPSGQIVFDLIAEITQQRTVYPTADCPGFSYYGGATVILGPSGNVRYSILKSIASETRLERRKAYFKDQSGQNFWQLDKGYYRLKANIFKITHDQSSP